MIGIVLEQFRKIENSSRTLEHVFAGVPTQTILECTCSDSVVTMIQNDMRVFPVVSNRHDRHFFWDHDLTYWSFDLMLLSFQFGNKKQKKY